MRCRRALGALLTIAILAPLPALCELCATDPCPMPTTLPPMESHCQMGSDGTTVDPPSAMVAADCCVGASDVAAATPGIPTQAPAGLALAPLAQGGVPNSALVLSSEIRQSEAPPPEVPAPLFTLYRSLLI